MKKKYILLLPCLLVLAGCGILSSEPYIQTYYFDIGSPNVKIETQKYVIDDVQFTTPSMYLQKMVFRVADNTILFDEFNRWSMSPDSLLESYFLMAIDNNDQSSNPKIKHYTLIGEILQITADIPNKTVSVNLRISLMENNKTIWTRTFKQKKPVQDVTGKSFAFAVKTSVDNIIHELNIFIDKTVK